MDEELQRIKELERNIRMKECIILEHNVGLMLMKLVGETIEAFNKGKVPDPKPYARRIVSYLREHII